MQIVQRKSKDAEMAEPVYVRLASVEIPGWIDEDGEQVTSAVIEQSDDAPAQQTPKKPSKHVETMRIIVRAWFAGGAEVRRQSPYISRSALRDFLAHEGLSESSVVKKTDPTNASGIIAPLLNAGSIEAHEHGWIVCGDEDASAMMMRRGA